MYIHIRPQKEELNLPADLYRWRGVDASEILTLRIETGLYHSERDNIEEKMGEGVELALKLRRDVPVFWGLGNHGGGATREALAAIDAFIAREKRVEVIHGTPDGLYEALKAAGRKAPVVEGDLQRVFTGCYTSLSRIKRKVEESLAALVQAETLCTASWWLTGAEFPEEDLGEAWRDHLLNDFHDILTGSCSQPAEKDELDLYGKVLEMTRRLRLGAASALNRSLPDRGIVFLPVTILNSNPALTEVPVEVECTADYRPFWKGKWYLRVLGSDGRQVLSQEEQPESLLPFNWRKKVCFLAELPGAGAARFEVKAPPGKRRTRIAPPENPKLKYIIDKNRGLIVSLHTRNKIPLLGGLLFDPLVVKDEGDSWGTGCSGYREIVGRFRFVPGSLKVIEELRGGGRTALAVIGNGQHGLDFKDGELRISALRSAAYCHERGFKLAESPARKFMDQAVHEMQFLVTAGGAEKVRRSGISLADC